MIVQCTNCRSKFNFPESELTGEGVWLKCGSCKNLFFLENPDYVEQAGTDETIPEDDIDLSADLRDTDMADMEEPDTEGPAGPYKRGMEPKRSKLVPALKGVGIAAALLLVTGVLYFVFFPEIGHNILREAVQYVPFSKELGLTGKEAPPVNTGIDFVNVKEKFVKNWIVGDIMVIQGTAVNKSNKPASLLKIKAKLLDQSGQFIAESSSYAGDIFSEEELLNLTEQEILNKLSFPGGSEYPNKDIAPDASIPFLIVFIKPPSKASEYIVELDKMEEPQN
ncbi:MAG: DUF3426 domain-containing protein [Syntrophaceae bacterium]